MKKFRGQRQGQTKYEVTKNQTIFLTPYNEEWSRKRGFVIVNHKNLHEALFMITCVKPMFYNISIAVVRYPSVFHDIRSKFQAVIACVCG